MTVLIGDEFSGVLAAARAGEEWAVARLYRSQQPNVLRYLSARSPGDGEDLAAQVWLEVARGLGRFEGGEDEFRALVFTIARRRLLNLRRTRRRRPTEPLDLAVSGEVVAPDDPAEEAAARVDGLAAAKRIVALLPRDQADIVLLRVVGGLSAEEVAAIVGKRPATVRVIQHRALRRLARALSAEPVTNPMCPGMEE
jgi:RNA polymerase sigma-70 factor (ECF subfamily)